MDWLGMGPGRDGNIGEQGFGWNLGFRKDLPPYHGEYHHRGDEDLTRLSADATPWWNQRLGLGKEGCGNTIMGGPDRTRFELDVAGPTLGHHKEG